MSQQGLNDFLARIASDTAMADALGAALGESGNAMAFDAMAAFAARQGFDVTPADAEAFYMNGIVGEEGELSDEALENVSGGSFLHYLDPRRFLTLPKAQVQIL